MTLNELDLYFNSFLKKEEFAADPSRNGIQIQNSSPAGKEITKVAFAVDASLDTVNRAAELGAQMLFVHHGIFWGGCETVTGIHYGRISAFIKNDIALYASHLPLDANAEVGNNYGLARLAGLKELEPFGYWRGMQLGVKGRFESPVSIEKLSEMVLPENKDAVLLPFGKKEISTVGIISGGGGSDYEQALEAGLDAFITGEIGHEEYNPVKESGLNVIAGGHYATETAGVKLVMEKLVREKSLEACFIDFPSGL